MILTEYIAISFNSAEIPVIYLLLTNFTIYKKAMKIFLIAVILIAISFIALGVRIFFRRGGKFPETEIGKNKKMRELGIYCVKCEEKSKWKKSKSKQQLVIRPKKLKIDLSRISGEI